MDYFKYFPYTRYVFGNEAEEIGTGKVITEVVQDISRYVDVIDEVKRSKAFSTQYYIQENERPDNVSQLLYGNPSYHWTFWLMNDHIREQGWPLTYRQMQKQLDRDFPGYVAITTTDLTGHYVPGEIVTGSTSGARAEVVRRRLDFGAIHLKMIGDRKFNSYERIVSKSLSALQTQAVNANIMLEYKSPHHYVNGSGDRVDIDPSSGPGALVTEVTIEDYYHIQNDKLKEINVIKPDSIVEVASLYREAISS
jgi:hypothetical protein